MQYGLGLLWAIRQDKKESRRIFSMSSSMVAMPVASHEVSLNSSQLKRKERSFRKTKAIDMIDKK